MGELPQTPMETTFNNFWKNVLSALLLVIGGVVLGFSIFFLHRKFKSSGSAGSIPSEMTVDKIEDARGLGYSGQRKISLDKNGNILVAYRKKYKGKSEIFLSKTVLQKNGTRVSQVDSPALAVGSGVDQRVPSIALDSKSVSHMVWYGSDTNAQPNNRQIKYANSQDSGASWSPWRNISYVSGYSPKEDHWQEHPSLLVGKANILYVVWEGKDEKNKLQQIKFTRSDNGGNTWIPWKNVLKTEGFTQSRPTLVEDGEGKLHLFMYSSSGNKEANQQVQYSFSSDKGEHWSAWKALSDPSSDARHISAAANQQGKINLVWRGGENSIPSKIMFSQMDLSGSWSQPIAVFPSFSYQFFPSVGVLPDGSPIVVWMEVGDASGFPREDPKGGQIMASLFRDGKFGKNVVVSGPAGGLYPNLPSLFSDSKKIFVTYEEPDGNGNFLVKIKKISN